MILRELIWPELAESVFRMPVLVSIMLLKNGRQAAAIYC